MLGLDTGVCDAPEAFLIDGGRVIRYHRHAGDLNARVWESELKPLWDEYGRRRRRNETVAGMVMLMLALVISGSARAAFRVMPFKMKRRAAGSAQLTGAAALPEMPEQQHCRTPSRLAMIATDMRRRVYDREGEEPPEIII